MRLKKLTANKWFKKMGLPLLVLLFLVLIIGLIINLYFSPILSAQLKKTVFRLSNGLYKADFEKSSLRVLAGRIVIDHLTLKPDTAVFNRLKKAGKAPNNLYILSVDKIVLKHIHPFKLYFKKELDVDELVISQPNIQAFYQEVRDHDVPDSGKKTLYQQISGILKSIHIGQISLENINLRYQEEIDHQTRIRHLKQIDLKVTDLLIDSVSGNDKSRFNFCKDITAMFNNFNGTTPDNLYQFQAKSVTFSSSKSRIKMVNAVFMPIKTASANQQQSLQPGTFKLETDSIKINQFDYKSFISYRKMMASEIVVYGKRANIFYDRTIKKVKVDSVKTGLYSILKNVHRDIAVKTLRLKNINVVYTEVSAKTKLRGTITFEQLNGTISNIVTGNDKLLADRELSANLTANLMGYGKMNVKLSFDPADPANVLYYKGNVGAMNLVNLNPATKTLGLIQFTNGIVTSLSFDMKADADKATGTVTFLYHDLNVLLLKQDEKHALSRMSFISILANAVVLIRNNPTYNTLPRVATIIYKRPENVSYLGLIWRSVYSGIKESIGLSAEIEQNLRKRVADYKQNKVQREMKKADRQERRRMRRLKRHLKEAQDF